VSVGELVGLAEGALVGDGVGLLALYVGVCVGTAVGETVGDALGSGEGAPPV
jgi:hypothetical protein